MIVMHLCVPFSEGRLGRTRTATCTEEGDGDDDVVDDGECGFRCCSSFTAVVQVVVLVLVAMVGVDDDPWELLRR